MYQIAPRGIPFIITFWLQALESRRVVHWVLSVEEILIFPQERFPHYFFYLCYWLAYFPGMNPSSKDEKNKDTPTIEGMEQNYRKLVILWRIEWDINGNGLFAPTIFLLKTYLIELNTFKDKYLSNTWVVRRDFLNSSWLSPVIRTVNCVLLEINLNIF